MGTLGGSLVFEQLRQVGDVRRDPPRLILAEQLGGRAEPPNFETVC
jgi:hypothetical protein